MTSLVYDRLVPSAGVLTFDRFVDAVGVPTITSVGSVQDGVAITITGTSFSASGNSVFAIQGVNIIALAVTSEGTTSITTAALDTTGLYVTRPLTLYVTNSSGVASNSVTTSVTPATGQAAFLVTQEFLGNSGSRIAASPDLAFGDEIRLRNVQGGTISDVNRTGQAATDVPVAVTSFEAAAFDGTLLGDWAAQTWLAAVTTVNPPNVVGQDVTAAQAAIVLAGLVPLIVDTVPSATVPANGVIAQFPLSSASVVLGSIVELTISEGIVFGLVPDLIGLETALALAALSAVGLTGTTTRVIDGFNTGRVLGQSVEKGRVIAVGSVVDLAVSSNLMPDLTGLLIQTATALIASAGLVLNEVVNEVFSKTYARSEVADQSPAADSVVSPGGTVTLTVSLGVQVGLGGGFDFGFGFGFFYGAGSGGGGSPTDTIWDDIWEDIYGDIWAEAS